MSAEACALVRASRLPFVRGCWVLAVVVFPAAYMLTECCRTGFGFAAWLGQVLVVIPIVVLRQRCSQKKTKKLDPVCSILLPSVGGVAPVSY